MKLRLVICLLAVLFLAAAPACAPQVDTDSEAYRLDLVRELKTFAAGFGFTETRNFKSYTPGFTAYDYYFYTPLTTLPYSLGDPLLEFGTGTADNITFERSRYDVFFYAIQAIAGVDTPVTGSLMKAPLERFIYVILHEDWHEQIDLPITIEEPSGEVVSYAAAMLFSRQKYGEGSAVYKTLEAELDRKLRESQVYAAYYDRLAGLYADFRAGKLSEADTLKAKAGLLDSMAGELQGISGAAPELNNAFIAFQMTYLRHLPLMQRVHTGAGRDLARTLDIFRGMPGQGVAVDSLETIKSLEKEITGYLRASLP